RGAVLDAFAVILGELDMAMPRLVHLGHEGLGGADRFLLSAAYPPMMLLVDLGVVAVEEGVTAFDRGVVREGIDELVPGRRRVGLRGRRHVGAGVSRRGGLFDLVVEIVVLHGGLQSAPIAWRSRPCRRGGEALVELRCRIECVGRGHGVTTVAASSSRSPLSWRSGSWLSQSSISELSHTLLPPATRERGNFPFLIQLQIVGKVTPTTASTSAFDNNRGGPFGAWARSCSMRQAGVWATNAAFACAFSLAAIAAAGALGDTAFGAAALC